MSKFTNSLIYLHQDVKSRLLPGLKLRITEESGSPNDFGIFNRNEGNPTAAYTDNGRDGYKDWIGKWESVISWDRDTLASPPDNLKCVHVTEVLREDP